MLVCQNLHHQVAVVGPAHTYYPRPYRRSDRTPAQSQGGAVTLRLIDPTLMSRSYYKYARPMVGILPKV